MILSVRYIFCIILSPGAVPAATGLAPGSSGLTPESLVIAVAGYVIVFLALVLLFGFFTLVPKLMNIRLTRKTARKEGGDEVRGHGEISGEETAAIAMALHLHMEEMHDRESGVLTIKRISRAYSPWSSKIYAVRNQFNRL